MELTAKQEKFAQLVAAGSTYADAYRETYNVGKKTTQNTIWCESSKIMDSPKVSQRVRELREETTKRNQVTLDEVLNEMANWLRFDPIELFDEDYCVKTISELPEPVRKSIASLEVVELFGNDKEMGKVKTGEIKKIKFIDKRAVSDQFLKKFGAYINTIKIDDDDIEQIKEMLKMIKE